MNPLTYDKIVKSRRRGDYLTTEYEFFLNKDYQPSKEQTDALLNRLTDDLEKTFRARYKKADVNKKADQLKPAFERRAAFKIRRLLDLRDDPDSINDILKRKEEQTEEIVNEVARRVAKRIVEAKRAHKKMNEALGRRRRK